MDNDKIKDISDMEDMGDSLLDLVDKNKIFGEEWLNDIEKDSLILLMKRGYRIESITDGFQVEISRIGEEGADSHFGFAENIDEAISEALCKAQRKDVKE